MNIRKRLDYAVEKAEQLDDAIKKIEELETYIEKVEAENRRLITKNDWLQDQAMFAAQAEHAKARNRSWGH